MSRWRSEAASPPPQDDDKKIEVEGITAQCGVCREETYTTWYLPEVGALSWRCTACGHLNVIEDFELPT